MANEILFFPIQKRLAEECEYREGVYQLKLEAAQMLNDVAAGTYLMSPGNIQAIKNVNAMCRKAGIPPLAYDPK
ncbi:hypothetical protein BN8_p06885 (plasmid) [Fibrisoma limi BUZ 3]|uniref:Uncharacterized protein n=1 Tax=Fibrisoma limi BUZ 3 TaxID=1185876 RepID=I2GU75_9BACT|nr:hypothetical protein [Fibrisoma limi]CCH57676.1 hypothetical protein BN8_p06885 [Fibrisoma limi BUZ 3]